MPGRAAARRAPGRGRRPGRRRGATRRSLPARPPGRATPCDVGEQLVVAARRPAGAARSTRPGGRAWPAARRPARRRAGSSCRRRRARTCSASRGRRVSRTRAAISASSVDHRAGVAGGAEVLAGVEAGRRDDAERARAAGRAGARPATGRRPRRPRRRAARRAPEQRSTGAVCPKRCTGTIAWVRGVIAPRTGGRVDEQVRRRRRRRAPASRRCRDDRLGRRDERVGRAGSPRRRGRRRRRAARARARRCRWRRRRSASTPTYAGVLALERGHLRPADEARSVANTSLEPGAHLVGDLGVLRGRGRPAGSLIGAAAVRP